MDFLIIGLVAFGASALTLFSGFGLGTLLLPAFALFFSAPIALAATGTVHLLNNLFKGSLVRKLVDWPTVLRFGLPAIPAAIIGASLLTYLDTRVAAIVIGAVLIIFAVLEFQTWFQRLTFPKKYLSLGGVLTGFMGGLSGQQGALRSMFLLKSDFDAKRYIATGVFIAVLIDLVRLPTYAIGLKDAASITQHEIALIGFGTLCAFAGAWLGARYMKKTTIGFVRYVVAGLMLVIGALLILGIIGN
ncbi:MAG: hypothetical protein AB203_01745 [Parcubacteria bacterium C7867-008]|nr:MAG: hypothetical protein AB203_01745 [Parcubacteria bacterium C7867-008]